MRRRSRRTGCARRQAATPRSSSRSARLVWLPSLRSLLEHEHARRRFGRIELGDEIGAALEYRALIDRALVGHLAGIERGRLADEDDAADAVRAARAHLCKRAEPRAQFLAHARVAGHVGGGGELSTSLEVRKDQRADLVAIGAGDDDVARVRLE